MNGVGNELMLWALPPTPFYIRICGSHLLISVGPSGIFLSTTASHYVVICMRVGTYSTGFIGVQRVLILWTPQKRVSKNNCRGERDPLTVKLWKLFVEVVHTRSIPCLKKILCGLVFRAPRMKRRLGLQNRWR
jgi:hypothetical protein